jgi:hypothetical protein
MTDYRTMVGYAVVLQMHTMVDDEGNTICFGELQ